MHECVASADAAPAHHWGEEGRGARPSGGCWPDVTRSPASTLVTGQCRFGERAFACKLVGLRHLGLALDYSRLLRPVQTNKQTMSY